MNDLDFLLKQAKREAFIRRTGQKIIRKDAMKPSRQADFSDWTVGKSIVLVHRDEEGKETALGVFIEHTRDGTRWLRPTANTLSPGHQEIVTGDFWTHPRIREIPMDSALEVVAIKSRFQELMAEYDEFFPVEGSAPVLPSPDDLVDDEDEDLDDDEEDDFEDEDDEDEEEEE